MRPDDITIMQVTTTRGTKSRLYYYQGNFFYPLESLSNDWRARIRFKIKQFKTANAAMIAADRAHPDYKTVLQLFDDQFSPTEATQP